MGFYLPFDGLHDSRALFSIQLSFLFQSFPLQDVTPLTDEDRTLFYKAVKLAAKFPVSSKCPYKAGVGAASLIFGDGHDVPMAMSGGSSAKTTIETCMAELVSAQKKDVHFSSIKDVCKH